MSNNGSDKMTITCPKCSQVFSTPVIPAEHFNTLRASVIVFTHPKVIRCPNNKCRQPYTIGLDGAFQANLTAFPISDDDAAQMDGSPIVPALSLIGH